MFLNSERAERLTARFGWQRTNHHSALLEPRVFQGEHADNGFVLFEFQSCRTISRRKCEKLRELRRPFHKHSTGVGEEHQIVVRTTQKLCDEVVFTLDFAALDACPATTLHSEGIDQESFGEAAVRQTDRHRVFFDKAPMSKSPSSASSKVVRRGVSNFSSRSVQSSRMMFRTRTSSAKMAS